MTFNFECRNCNCDFEIEIDLLTKSKSITCPECKAKARDFQVEDMANALDDLMEVMTKIHGRFRMEIQLESNEFATDDFQDEEEDNWLMDEDRNSFEDDEE